jgi:hypothetical protein
LATTFAACLALTTRLTASLAIALGIRLPIIALATPLIRGSGLLL